jgi:hypothetical protein
MAIVACVLPEPLYGPIEPVTLRTGRVVSCIIWRHAYNAGARETLHGIN